MMTRASYFVWVALSPLERIQFSWRWLTVLSVIGSICFVVFVSDGLRRFDSRRTTIFAFVVLLILTMAAFDVRQSFARENRVSRAKFEEILKASTHADPVTAAAWWPVWAKAKAFDISEKVNAGDRTFDVLSWETTERHFRIGEGTARSIRVATFYYPLWEATVNGVAVDVESDENGVIMIPVGGETSDVIISFRERWFMKLACWFSVLSWISAVLWLGCFLSRKMSRRTVSTPREV